MAKRRSWASRETTSIWANDPINGPQFPAIPTAAKFRRVPFAELSSADRRAYGTIVLERINAMNRTAGMRQPEAQTGINCASGTWHADGRAILKAVRAQQLARLSAVGEWDYGRGSKQERANRIYAEWIRERDANRFWDERAAEDMEAAHASA